MTLRCGPHSFALAYREIEDSGSGFTSNCVVIRRRIMNVLLPFAAKTERKEGYICLQQF